MNHEICQHGEVRWWDGSDIHITTSCQPKHFFQFTSENLVIGFSNHLVIKTQLNTFWNKRLASLFCFVCKLGYIGNLGYLIISNLHNSSRRDFIMSIQEWKNHQTYLIFPHVLEVCFLEKARKKPFMG